MQYKIVLNVGDTVQPPWRVIDERGDSQYFHDINFECKPRLAAEKDKEVRYKGWIIADGQLIVDHEKKIATIR